MKNKSVIHARSALAASCLMLCMWVGLWWNCVTLYADPIIGEWGISRTQFMLVATIMALTNAVVQMFFYGKIQAKLGIRCYIRLKHLIRRKRGSIVWIIYFTNWKNSMEEQKAQNE